MRGRTNVGFSPTKARHSFCMHATKREAPCGVRRVAWKSEPLFVFLKLWGLWVSCRAPHAISSKKVTSRTDHLDHLDHLQMDHLDHLQMDRLDHLRIDHSDIQIYILDNLQIDNLDHLQIDHWDHLRRYNLDKQQIDYMNNVQIDHLDIYRSIIKIIYK